MKVFISWSGQPSQAVAELLKGWIKCTLQSSEPWISTHDIDRGAAWFAEISGRLQEASIGIICLTKSNKEKPWILFEAGALAKGLTTNRVCPVLIDLEASDIEGPLAQFNHTSLDKVGMWSLLSTLNGCLGDQKLDQAILEKVFQVYWPSFEAELRQALADNPVADPSPPRTEDSMLSEILMLTRGLSKRVADLESNSFRGNSTRTMSATSDINLDQSFKASEASEIGAAIRDGIITEDQALEMLVSRGLYAKDALKFLEKCKGVYLSSEWRKGSEPTHAAFENHKLSPSTRNK
ncbi:toll/interleukin-1 receptor domain-containing protein [Halopseudomonas oceani]|uniref:toll/interleukin-1 receptor domain-containing protein n=1 Tax=Halopseudomonas oceani TaxID=1708783 RepID=UPI002AA932CA|nr:toll/interleukin-1 receptor domain-containing protein [Halopseudomonas oceani]